MPPFPRRLTAPALLLALTAPLATAHAQSEGRIWGAVHTRDGERHEGFLRFGGGLRAASWADPFTIGQPVGEGPRRAWLDASESTDAILRTVELAGHRITWNHRSEDFPEERGLSIRVGALREIVLLGDTVELALRPLSGMDAPVGDTATPAPDAGMATGGHALWSGADGRLRGEAPSGWEEAEILVEDPRRGVVTVRGDEVRRIEFAAAPAGSEAASARLVGALVDESGRRFNGPIIWNDRGVLESDALGGGFSPASVRDIVLGDIRSIERLAGGADGAGGAGGTIARVTLVSGEVVDLSAARRGRDPVEEIVVLDAGLGRVTVDWDEFQALHLRPDASVAGVARGDAAPGDAPDPATTGHAALTGGTPLRGTVVTEGGEEVAGRIRWNALEEWSWETLRASSDGLAMAVRFANIARIEKVAHPDDPQARWEPGRTPGPSGVPRRWLAGRALVTLRDGRVFEMSGTADLGAGNLGMLVLTDSSPGEPEWRYIAWEDVGEVRFVDVAAGAQVSVARTAPMVPAPSAPADRFADDAFLDPVARELYSAAYDGWDTLGEIVERYTARIDQRIAVALRMPLKDRILYHSETSVRAFWERDRRSVVQVLGSRAQYPGRSIAMQEGDLDWLQDFPFDEPFAPGSDQLFGGAGRDEEPFQPTDDDFWLAHPLGEGADILYQFRSGDTTTLTLQDGRHLDAVQLDVLPREIDPHRISGSLWIDAASGAVVRGIYRLSRAVEPFRDIPAAREEGAEGYRYVPGFLKPISFHMRLIAVDYSLWEFEAWLPRSVRFEGELAMGVFKVPVSTDVAYRIESVTLQQDETAAGAPFVPPLTHVHFDTRAEAMALIAQLLSDTGGPTYEPVSAQYGRTTVSRLIAPSDQSVIEHSPELPPPIWDYAPGFPSEEDLEEYIQHLAALPVAPTRDALWSFDWGWGGRDMLRYNRVEGPAVGGDFRWGLHGSHALGATGHFGLADLMPKARLDLERATVLRRLNLGVYHELRPTAAESGYLGLGNSLDAFLFGRDNGEYYYSTGADFTWRPPAIARQTFSLRTYAERQRRAETNTNFALFRAFNRDWDFRPNVEADEVEEAGGELRLSPWWGSDPVGAQFGLELFGRGATWRRPGEDLRHNFGQASATLRAIVPVRGSGWRRVRLGFEAAGGHTWGDAPVQRSWFLGGAGTMRGYPASTLSGLSFLRSRVELGRSYEGFGGSLFGDAGWAGPADDFQAGDILYGIGVGASIMDGIVRLDLSQGLKGPNRGFRVELYLDHIL